MGQRGQSRGLCFGSTEGDCWVFDPRAKGPFLICHGLLPGTMLRKRDKCDQTGSHGAGVTHHQGPWHSVVCVSRSSASPGDAPSLGSRRSVTHALVGVRPNIRPQGLCSKFCSPPVRPQVWGLWQPAAEDTRPHCSLSAVPSSTSWP